MTAFCVILSVLFLAGCQPRLPKPEKTPDITLRLWTLQMGAFAPLMRSSLAEFEHDHPGVRVQWEDLPFAEGKKRAIAAMLSPTVPDVINLNPGFAAVLAERGALVDMARALSEQEQAAYLPVVWQSTLIQQDHGLPAHSVGLPWYVTTTVTLAHRPMLGTDVAVPESWDQVEALARKLHSKNIGKVMMPALAENGSFLKLLRREGIEPISPQTGCLIWSQNALVAARLGFFKSLYDRRLIPAEALTEGHRAAVEQYLAGRLALLSIGPNFLATVHDNAPEVYAHTHVAPAFPQTGFKQSGYLDVSPMVLVVPVKSAHPELALALARHLTQAGFQLALAKRVPVLPSIRAAYTQDPAFFGLAKSSPPESSLEVKARALAAQQLLSAKVSNPLLANEAPLNAAVDFAVQSALLGQVSIPEALQQAEHAVNGEQCH